MLSILVVDDDEDFAQALAKDFLRQGAQTARIAASSQDALVHATRDAPDLATVDLCLGRAGLESGFHLIPELKKIAPSARIAVVTDYWSVSTYAFTLHLGAHAFLGKPTTAAAILKMTNESREPISRPHFRYASLEKVEREHIPE